MVGINEILENKRKEIGEFKELHGEHIYAGGKPERSFIGAFRGKNTLGVIAEVKRMSPSRGVINESDKPEDVASVYESSGVQAVSVLTDKKFFGGGFEFLSSISKKVSVPLLCKDFILDNIQIDLAKLSGASAVLLIADILDDKALAGLYDYARKEGMDVLLEAHAPENIRRAAGTGAEMIGINNRDLITMKECKEHSLQNAGLIPSGRIKISLSSIDSRDDAVKAAQAGFNGVLIGTALMRAFNKKAAVRSFLNIPISD